MKKVLWGILISALLLTLLMSGISCTKTVNITITQGHELGTELIYKADLSQIGNESAASAMQGVIDIITRRLDAYGVSEASIQKLGSNQVVVQLPGVRDVEAAINLIGSTAQLEFKELVYDSEGNPVLDSSGNCQWILATAVDSSGQEVPLTGQYLERNAKVVFSRFNNWPQLVFQFDSEGANLFSQITGRLIDKPLGIFLDNQLLSSPKVMRQLGAEAVVCNIPLDEAKTLVIQLNSGAMPCPLTLVSRHSSTPSLTVTPTPTPISSTVATINNTTISMDYFVKMLQYYYLVSNGNVSSDTFPYQVLQQIESDELMRQGALELGIKVSPDEIVAKINNDLISSARGVCNSAGDITGNITVPQSDLGKIYQQLLDYVHLSDSEYRQVIEVTLLTPKLEDFSAQSIPTEGKQVHVYAIKVDNEGNAIEVANRLQNGEDFATLAAEFSTSELLKQYGGDLGWVPQGFLPAELDQAAFSLAAGNVSGIIVGTGGYYFIKVSEIEENRPIDEYARQGLAYIAFANWFTEQRETAEIREYLDQTTATWAMNQIT